MKYIVLYLNIILSAICLTFVSCSGETEEEGASLIQPPVLVETLPADGATGLSCDLSEIRLTFDQDVYVGATASDEVSLKPDVEIEGIQASGKTVVISIPSLQQGTRYTLTVPLGVLTGKDKQAVEKITLSFTTKSVAAVDVAPDMTGVEKDSYALLKQIRVGWNLGNSLESYYDGLPDHMDAETSWGNPIVTQDMILKVKEAGFNAVRIPVRWYPHATDQNTMEEISSEWLGRVKEVVDYCISNGMYAIINTHHEDWLESHPLKSEAEEVLRKERNLWRAIATYFRDYDEHLIFSGTNEVEINWQAPTRDNLEVQNRFNQCFVDAVRSTGGRNYYRNLIIQTYATNPDYSFDGLIFPDDVSDRRISIEFHYYRPAGFSYMDFADYTESVYFWGKDYIQYNEEQSGEQEDYVDGFFRKIKSYWVDKGYPVVMGEYGAVTTINRSVGYEAEQIASRKYYMEYVTRAARTNGIVPFVWDNGSFNTVPDYKNEYFGLFNRKENMETNEVSKAMIEGIMNGCDTEYPF